MAADGSGNYFLTGSFERTVDFGGGAMTSAGLKDVFVAEYAADGTQLWTKRFGGTANDIGRAVKTDEAGNVIVVGYFEGTINFGGGALTSAGQRDIFVAKLSGTDGSHLWSKRFGNTTNDEGHSVAVDGSGNVFVTGLFRKQVDFGGGILSSAFDGADTFVAKYSSTGAHVWSKNFYSTSDDVGRAIAVDTAGNIALAGDFLSAVNFGGAQFSSNMNSLDAYVVKLSSSGAHVWSRSLGGIYSDGSAGVGLDSAGNVVVGGYFSGSVDFGAGTLVADASDGFVAQYASTNGGHLWSKKMGGAGSDYLDGLALGGSGEVVVTGSFEKTANFGGGTLTSAGLMDAYVVKLSSGGAHVWSKRLGGSGADSGARAIVDGSSHVAASGFFQGSAEFDSQILTSAGSYDLYLLRLAP